MPLITAAAVELEHHDIRAAGVCVQRARIAVALPRAVAVPCDENIAACVPGNGKSFVGAIRRSIESMPLIAAAAVELEYHDIPVVSSGERMQRARIMIPLPCVATYTCDIYVAAVDHKAHAFIALPIFVALAVASVEGMPLITAAAVELENEDIAVVIRYT